MKMKFVKAEVEHAGLGKRKLIHWNKFSPKEILDEIHRVQIENNPNDKFNQPDSKAIVYRGKIGKYQVAVRSYITQGNSQRRTFKKLVVTARRKRMPIEVPIALVSDPEWNHKTDKYMVTIWNKGEDLGKYLARPEVKVEEKTAAIRAAIDKVARLHQKGYVHMHPHFNNILISNGKVKLIDASQLAYNKNNTHTDRDSLLESIIYHTRHIGQMHRLTDEETNAIKEELIDHLERRIPYKIEKVHR